MKSAAEVMEPREGCDSGLLVGMENEGEGAGGGEEGGEVGEPGFQQVIGHVVALGLGFGGAFVAAGGFVEGGIAVDGVVRGLTKMV